MNLLSDMGGLLLGVAIGAISGLIGVGGGAFLIPALVLFYGMTEKRAQGTSLATLLAPIGIFAFWEYYKDGQVDVKLSILVALGFAAGGWFGGLWAQHLSDTVLRRSFAALLILLGLRLAFGR
ncbi:MAG: TSUP family transporter [Acidobacteriota bacterium]